MIFSVIPPFSLTVINCCEGLGDREKKRSIFCLCLLTTCSLFSYTQPILVLFRYNQQLNANETFKQQKKKKCVYVKIKIYVNDTLSQITLLNQYKYRLKINKVKLNVNCVEEIVNISWHFIFRMKTLPHKLHEIGL